MAQGNGGKTAVRWLVLILALSALVRYYGISNAENTDEYNEVFEALRVASGEFNLNRWHKKGLQNILAVEYGVYYLIGYLGHDFKSPLDFAAKVIHNMDPLFLIGRYSNAALGTGSVLLLFLIGRRLYNDRVGLMAAALLAVTTMHVWTSHLVNTDVPLTFFFLLSFYFVARSFRTGQVRDYVLAAFVGAVAINMKIIGAGIGIIFIGAHLARAWNEGRTIRQALVSRVVGYSAAAFVGGLLVSNPAILLGFKQWLQSFIWQYGVYTNVYDEVPHIVGNAYYTYVLAAYREFGAPLLLLIVLGIAYAAIKRTAWDYILLAFAAVLFLVLANSSYLVESRYLMTMLPALFLFAARLVDSESSRLLQKSSARLAGIAVVTLVVAAYPLAKSAIYVASLTEDNTSKVSKQWIEENIPAGSKLLVDAGHTIITAGPRLNQSREKLERQLAVIKNLKEGETYDSPLVKVVDSYSAVYFELLLQQMPAITYDITTTELGRDIESIDYYREQGFDYVIHNADLRDWLKDPVWRAKYPKSAAFYEGLDHELRLVKSFGPSWLRSGTTIRIYQIPRATRSS